MRKKINLTEGSVGKNILLFALPLLGSSLIQQLYSTVDLIFTGQFLGTQSAAAIGASDLLITCLVGFFTGMAVGTSVITAQLYGAGRHEALKKLICTMFRMGLAGGFVLMLFAEIFAPVFLRWMGTPEQILSLAVRYLRIYILSMVSVVLYNLLSGIVRALGDSRSPMLFQLLGGIVNVLADFVCIVVLKMGVEGTAAATFLSQTFAAGCVVWYLFRLKEPYALTLEKGQFDKSLLKQVFGVGIPSGVQSVATTLSNILIQAQINTLGVASIAAFTVYFKTELFVYLPILALGQAVVSFVGQNYGAGKEERIRQGNRICIFGGSAAVFLWSLCLMLCSSRILGIFSKDAEVIKLAGQIIFITFPFYFLYMMLECISSNLRGYGYAFMPMAVTVLSFCGIRLLVLFRLFKIIHNVRGVALAYPISWAAALILLSGVFFRFHSRRKKGIQKKGSS